MVNAVTKAIGLTADETKRINERLKEEGEWAGTNGEWKEWMQRLIMDAVGNF